ncbi:hypothetical protein TWF730_005870 [Orbilia blumenaviensis]|uniref:Uncharacterized protein n=1 Tax=Orbilia blumenaviensis TaxID=1796055 RepID=A0AAV9VLW6_9PEZI
MRSQHPWFLVLLYAANQGYALPDDKNYGKDSPMTKYIYKDPNSPDLEEVTYSWEGVIKSMFSDEKDTCLTVDIFTIMGNDWEEKKGQFEVFPDSGTKVGIYKCPGSLGDAKAYQKWLIKGKVLDGRDPEPVFEGYIRSNQVTDDGERLCLTARHDPGMTPLASWRHAERQEIPWHNQAKYYDWRWRQDDEGINPMHWVYHDYWSSWGVVYLDYCRENDPSQTWWIGLTANQDGDRIFPDDPRRWNWIRPKEMPRFNCQEPIRDADSGTPDAWCKKGENNCKPNYSWHPGLMRPYMTEAKAGSERLVQWVMLGCSPSNWMFQQNFALLTAEGQIRDKMVGTTKDDPRIAPLYIDPDLARVKPDGDKFEIGKENYLPL